MPASSTAPGAYRWRESWPPVQLRLHRSGQPAGDDSVAIRHKEDDHGQEIHVADDNPLVYFLTPAPLLSDDEDEESYTIDDSDSSYYYDEDSRGEGGMDLDFEFDAGIEDAAHPQPIVRSVSPSALAEGMGSRLPRVVRPPTPPRSGLARRSFIAEPAEGSRAGSLHSANLMWEDADAKGENHAHPSSGRHFDSFNVAPSGLLGHATTRIGKTPSKGAASTEYLSSSPTPSSPGSPRRSSTDIHGFYTYQNNHNAVGIDVSTATTLARSQAGATIVRRRSPRSWRVPSPDVFSIEEEAEEGPIAADALNQTVAKAQAAARGKFLEVEVEVAKPKRKQVRFVLPHEEVS